MSTRPSRWETHKRRTRDSINSAAMELFFAAGFDNVTVSDVAEHADVSIATVFNYFETKEDLFFDETVSLADDLVAAVRTCPHGASVLDALRAHIDYQLTGGRGKRQYREVGRFHAAIAGSVALQRHEQEIAMYRRDRLGNAIAEAIGDPSPGLRAHFAAAQYLAVENLVTNRLRSRLQEGCSLAVALRELSPDIDALFADVRTGVGSLPKTHE